MHTEQSLVKMLTETLRGLSLTERDEALEKVIVGLANARDAESLQAFLEKSRPWGGALLEEATQVIHKDFLSGSDPEIPEELRPLAFLAYLLRRLWTGDEEAVRKAEAILLREDRSGMSIKEPFRLDWRRGGFVYLPRFFTQRLIDYLLRKSSFAKVCANLDCENPYFIGTRGNERYCSEPCFDAGRKRAKKAWWDEHGEGWKRAREEALKQWAQKKGGKKR